MTELMTFHIPEKVVGSKSDRALGADMIAAWQADGIFQIARSESQEIITHDGFATNKRFFARPMGYKAQHTSDLSYTGYIASGEEITAGKPDYSEIYTVTKDLPLDDPRVRAGWPCHGPAPWPDLEYRDAMARFMGALGEIGDKLLRLLALALNLESMDTLANIARDGWHHMRVLRFPAETPDNEGRGISAHTDYGLLVIAGQDDVGGLHIRPPVAGEKRPRNWLEDESAAGMFENEEPWTFVTPVPKVFTVFPGDMFQFITDGMLLSTPHKVRLASRERYAMAYFHEPNFNACIRPWLRRSGDRDEFIHYGTHFTNMFIRNYAERMTTKRIIAEDRLTTLAALRTASALA
ncbi:hypothetical protein OG563_46700 [Nocardia vinacea]|uniref:Fe2OG dioxygenase domain-containing protein n=1 Tax=Nocardia vinacea TaxID=96468 RepID=A0ABZ1YT53_9NOCA|nr:2-oxoglutarate and iron-dependent oxygenase domain-containing protein [Nocardia vinacea]